jgi:catechol 2,3-dioxygenase-like lactoylglutathione lyase family enzyme
MKSTAMFLGGMLAGALLIQLGIAQDASRRGLNHVGIATHNYDAALAFYKDTLGAREAFTIRNPDGTVRITYLQVSRDTFIELLPVAADQPAGIAHIGNRRCGGQCRESARAGRRGRRPDRRRVEGAGRTDPGSGQRADRGDADGAGFAATTGD